MAPLQNENYNLPIKEHLEAGMQQLVFLVQLLLLPWPNEETCAKAHNHVSTAFSYFSEAEQKLESHLVAVDSQSEGLIAIKKLMQDNLQEKKGNVVDLNAQIVAFKEAEKKSVDMLEASQLRLESAKEQLRLAHEKVEKNHAGRDLGAQLMFLPGLGTIIGAGMLVGYQVALESAENLVVEAQGAVELYTSEVAGYHDEITHFSQKEQELQAEINASNQKISQIQAQCDELLTLQRDVTVKQTCIRKCLVLLDTLAGKIHAAAVMSNHTCIPELLVDVLEEIAQAMEGKNEVAFLEDREIQASVLEINKAVKSLKGRVGSSMLQNY